MITNSFANRVISARSSTRSTTMSSLGLYKIFTRSSLGLQNVQMQITEKYIIVRDAYPMCTTAHGSNKNSYIYAIRMSKRWYSHSHNTQIQIYAILPKKGCRCADIHAPSLPPSPDIWLLACSPKLLPLSFFICICLIIITIPTIINMLDCPLCLRRSELKRGEIHATRACMYHTF